jgi:hypothetical protein
MSGLTFSACTAILTVLQASYIFASVHRGSTLADHLTKRAGYWHFHRRVPKEYAALDPSGVIRHSTKVAVATDKRGNKAGKIADAMNRKLEAYWRALYEGKVQAAQDHYNEYRRLARNPLGFDRAETAELANRSTLVERLVERLEKLVEDPDALAPLLGTAKQPAVEPSKVFSKDKNQTRNEVKDIGPMRRKKNKQLANKQTAVPQPIQPTLRTNLVMLGRTFAGATGVKIETVGTNSTKTAKFYTNLESGQTSFTLRKYDMLIKWFAKNWPEGHTMPTLKDPQHYPNPKGE